MRHYIKGAVMLLGICFGIAASAQDTACTRKDKNGINRKGSFYFYWGYNREIFSKSNIHLRGPGYDFTVYDVKAYDRPESFKARVYMNPTLFSIPQFNVRFGYFINNRWSLSFGYDHMKYVMSNRQVANVSGIIDKSKSIEYSGTYLNKPMYLSEDFLKFEHTDGLNVFTLDAEYNYPIINFWKNRLNLTWTGGIGGIWVAPRTDARVMGVGINNSYHVAGFTLTAKTGPRINILRKYFISYEARGGYISLPSIFVNGYDSGERAEQNFSFMEFYVVAGAYFKIGAKHK